MDLRILITSREERDASIIWDDQDQWQIRSWRFYALPAIHVLETEAGDIMYMFIDKKYPLTPETIQRMLNHGLEIDRDLSAIHIVIVAEVVLDWCFSLLGFLLLLQADNLPFSTLLVHQRFNKDKQKGFKDDHGASSSKFKIIMLLLILLAVLLSILTLLI
nr:hypothetical protein [Tanacetum cinerariifolium]